MPHSRPLQLLFELIAQPRSIRLEKFLADFDNGFASKWAFSIPEHFKESLDIRLTNKVTNKNNELIWTQGSRFDFREGYVIYDTPMSCSVCSEALQHVNVAFQIIKSSPAIPATNEPTTWPERPEPEVIKKHIAKFGENYVSHEEETKRNGTYTLRVQTKRFGGYLEVAKICPNNDRSCLVKIDEFPISQDGFVEWLITGTDPMLRKRHDA